MLLLRNCQGYIGEISGKQLIVIYPLSQWKPSLIVSQSNSYFVISKRGTCNHVIFTCNDVRVTTVMINHHVNYCVLVSNVSSGLWLIGFFAFISSANFAKR